VLMDGRTADAAVMDPPYGIDYGDVADARKELGKAQKRVVSSIAGDDTTGALTLWAAVFPHVRDALTRKGSAYYCWGPPGIQSADLGHALRDAGLEPHGGIVWNKQKFSFSRSEHKYSHEPAWYGWRTDGTHEWHGPNNETSVWDCQRPGISPDHPTMKPVELIRRCVTNITQLGDLVIDPFLGSGTTLIASELDRRVFYGIELSPGYVDGLLRRWETLTGVVPVRGADGTAVSFTGVAE
jgi:DNA modification methylase